MPLEVKIVLPPFLDVHLHNDQLVMQVVEIVLHFVVGQFAVDEVSEVVVVATFAVFGCLVVDLRQGVVAVGIGVDIGISAVPNESRFLFEVV